MSSILKSNSGQRAKYIVSDLLTSMLAMILFNIYRYYGLNLRAASMMSLWEFITLNKLILEDIFIPIALLGIYWLSGFYNQPFGKSRLAELAVTFMTAIFNALLIYFALMVNDPLPLRSTSYELIIVLSTLLFSCTYVGRYCITQNAIDRFYRHKWSFRTIVIGNSRFARQKAFELCKSTSRLGYDIEAFVEIPGEIGVDDDNRVITFDQLPQAIHDLNIDQLVIVTEHHDESLTLSLLNRLFPLNIPIKIWPDTLTYITQGIRLQDIFGEPFIDLASPSCTDSTINIKRTLDVIVSTLVLVLISPLLATLAIAVKASSKGPVIYAQERVGYRKRKFKIYKFRSMTVDAEANGPQLSSENDARITPLGHIMRKYRLDELPQFWNVIRGDMSLVGPRPEREFFINQIIKDAPWYTMLHQVRPGITSWGMVKYGYAENVEQMIRRARYDMIYISNMSIIVDIKILIYTIKTVVTGKGV